MQHSGLDYKRCSLVFFSMIYPVEVILRYADYSCVKYTTWAEKNIYPKWRFCRHKPAERDYLCC